MVAEDGVGVLPTSVAQSTRARPMPPPGFVLLAAVFAMSWAAPLIRFATADALAIAAWRLILSVAVVAALLAVRWPGRGALRLAPRAWGLALCSGLLLAAHFWSWIASLEWTSVSSSVALVSTQPIFVALMSATFLGERATGRQWIGIALAVPGAAIIGWGDAGAASSTTGNVLALLGAGFAAGYYVIGRRLRQRLDLRIYIGVVYGIAALALTLAAAAMPGVALTGHPPRDWLIFAALAAGPMLIGHTGINYALRYLPAYVANLAALGEPVGATLIAWALPAIAETPTPQVLVGGILIGAGIMLGSERSGGRPRRPDGAEGRTVTSGGSARPVSDRGAVE